MRTVNSCIGGWYYVLCVVRNVHAPAGYPPCALTAMRTYNLFFRSLKFRREVTKNNDVIILGTVGLSQLGLRAACGMMYRPQSVQRSQQR